jgi:hypothetical protein
MKTLKNSVNAFALLLMVIATAAIVMPFASRGQGGSPNAPPHQGLRKFYVTQTFHAGNEALAACSAGYHMASMWEILDVSNLQYDTSLGLTRPDSGSGPPTLGIGWIRTGMDAGDGNEIGTANCSAYTNADHDRTGTRVFLPRVWTIDPNSLSPEVVVRPWVADLSPCDQKAHVWCVQD